MNINERSKAFVALGQFLAQFKTGTIDKDIPYSCNESLFDKMDFQIKQVVHYNGWFTQENVLFAIHTWAKTLEESNVKKWLSMYDFNETYTKTIGVITAGNIPLVGFHDFITVLMSGHKVLVKQSSNDQQLLPVLAEFLIGVSQEFSERIHFTEGTLKGMDAVIATGSNNTARYFEQYFGTYPHIIRKNRNAVAVLTGEESPEELSLLGEDIFRYFGLGCRSVSKIFIPEKYDFNLLFNAVYEQRKCIDYKKYQNNYDYNKTVYLMSQIPILDNGFFVLKEDTAYASPIATLFYEYYSSLDELKHKLMLEKDQIQCIVGSKDLKLDTVPFGETQLPQLWDYADGVDTMRFLLQL